MLGDERDPKVRSGNETASATAWSLENPQTPLLWIYPAIRDATAAALSVDFDMCQYEAHATP